MSGSVTCLAQPKQSYSAAFTAVPTRTPAGRYPPHKHDYIDAFYGAFFAWRDETRYSSFARDTLESQNFRKIVALGEAAIPLVIHELRKEPSMLFLALREILGENHAPQSARGDPRAMVEAWLMWFDRTYANDD